MSTSSEGMQALSLRSFVQAVLFVGVATGLTALLWPRNAHTPYAIYYLAVFAATIYGNIASGLLAVLLSNVAVDYFFLPPLNAFTLTPEALMSAILFTAVGFLLVFLVHRFQQRDAHVRDNELLLREVTESARVGLALIDEREYYIFVNSTYAELFALEDCDRIVGRRVQDVLGHMYDQIKPRIVKALAGERVTYELRAPSGGPERWFNVTLEPRAHPSGARQIVVALTDISARKHHESEYERLNRLYAALSHVNQAIVRMPTRGELFRQVCRILVERGGFHMAWVGWHHADSHWIESVAEWGDDIGYVRNLRIYSDERPEGRGPTGRAFRTARPYICNSIADDPNTLPWRVEMQRRGFQAMAVFPIRLKGQVCGTLTVYAVELGFFLDKEIALLEEAAADISIALDTFAANEERREAEAGAQREMLFSDAMIESMPGVVYFYDTRGHFLRWNQNFMRVSGYSAEEIEHLHPLDFFSAAEKPVIEQRIGEVFEKGEASVEAQFMSKHGALMHYFFTGRRVLFNGEECLVGVGIDIAQRKQAEERLADSERKYRELVELANSIILRWTSEGRITFLNEFGQRFFGYSAEEIVGRHVLDTIVPPRESSGRDLQALMERICADPRSFEHNVNENMRRNGERVWIDWSNRVVQGAKGEAFEILSFGTDITERTRIQQALSDAKDNLEIKVTERTAELQVALTRAEAADRIKSAFLATMSHELRTPLNSILGFTGIVLQGMAGPLNAEQTKQLGMVRTSARHLLDLINDVLDISKIEAGQLQVHAEPLDLRASVERVAGVVKPLAEKRGLTLCTEMPETLPAAVSDRRRVEQVLLNLLNNAIKFTERGEVKLAVEVLVDYKAPKANAVQTAVRFRVSDTGMGIKPADLATLFQPFRQIDSGLTRQHEGTGLGLAICRRLADLLGGRIDAHSEWGKGSVFSFVMPLNREIPRS